MVTFDFTGLLVVAVVAFLAPLLAGLVPGRLMPAVVLEVLLGVAVGPQGLGWVKPQGAVQLLYLMGLGFLLFLAGQEHRPQALLGPHGGRNEQGLRHLARGRFPSGPGAHLAGVRIRRPPPDRTLPDFQLSRHPRPGAYRDAGEINSDFGQLTVMAGTVGEFASLLLLTILFSADAESTPEQILYVAIMGVAAAFTGLGLYALWRSGRMARVFTTLDDSASAAPGSGCVRHSVDLCRAGPRLWSRLASGCFRGRRCPSCR